MTGVSKALLRPRFTLKTLAVSYLHRLGGLWYLYPLFIHVDQSLTGCYNLGMGVS